jgi:signal transduction histidine kinase
MHTGPGAANEDGRAGPRAIFARFSDPEWERRFRRERLAGGLNRARWALALGLALVASSWALEAAAAGPRPADYDRVAFRLRIFVIEPIWLAALLATWWRGFPRHADAILAAATPLASWAMALNQWHYCLLHPGEPMAVKMVFALLPPLLISGAAFPIGAAAHTAMSLAATLAPAAFVTAAAPVAWRADARIAAAGLAAAGAAVAAWGWWRDADERRQFAQRERERAREAELARLTAERNEFVAIAAHDLRAPLAAVRGLAAQLHAGRLADEAQRARAHAAIHLQAGRMLDLVNAYLGAHAAESGAPAVKPAPVELRAAAEAARARHGAAAEAKQQQIAVAGAGPGVVWALADETLLAQVADNFLANALKFSPRGAAVRIDVGGTGERLRLAVTDNGPGIAAEEQAELFRKFRRASTRPTDGEPSHGLGLAVAKRLAEAMGGSVGCESRPGAGATFWVELPAAPPPAPASGAGPA